MTIIPLFFSGLLSFLPFFGEEKLPVFDPPPQQYFREIPSLEENYSLFSPHESFQNIEVSAHSAVVLDVATGVALFTKNEREHRSIASLTKLMTAILVLEQYHNQLDTSATIPSLAMEVEGSRMFLLSGEEMTIANLLRGLLIRSANDAAVTLANTVGGTQEHFVELMNRRAHYLGLENTHFTNPHGLDNPENYSTARDVAFLAKYALTFPFIRETVSLREETVFDVSGKFSHTLKTTNELLGTSFPIFGLKTGTTEEAGECFVGLATLDKRDFLIVLLGSENRFQDTKALLWSLENSL